MIPTLNWMMIVTEFSSSDIESESETDGAVSDTHGADTSVVTSDDASVVMPTAKTMDTSSTRRKRPSKKDTADEFIWTSDVSVPTADFTETSGFRNLPANLIRMTVNHLIFWNCF